jgi:glutamate 5-kinase
VIKVGSAVLADEANGHISPAMMRRLAKLISAWMEKARKVVLVSSGAIAAGRGVLDCPRPRSLPEKQALAATGQSRLMHQYDHAFGRFGRKVAQILLTRDDMNNRRRYLNARYTIEHLLALGVVPIVNENDTIATDEIEFGDNDMLASLVAVKIQAGLLLILTTVDGLMTADPAHSKDARLVPLVERVTPEIEALVYKSRSSLGRGGMETKIKAAQNVMRAGIPAILANGRDARVWRLLAKDRVRGTYFLPHDGHHFSRREQWILAARTGRKKVQVDDGARKALIDGKKSLLAAGISKVAGDFRPGDVVDIVDGAGRAFACGLANYSARDIDRMKGLKTTQISALLGQKPPYEEIIHRDNMVIIVT